MSLQHHDSLLDFGNNSIEATEAFKRNWNSMQQWQLYAALLGIVIGVIAMGIMTIILLEEINRLDMYADLFFDDPYYYQMRLSELIALSVLATIIFILLLLFINLLIHRNKIKHFPQQIALDTALTRESHLWRAMAVGLFMAMALAVGTVAFIIFSANSRSINATPVMQPNTLVEEETMPPIEAVQDSTFTTPSTSGN